MAGDADSYNFYELLSFTKSDRFGIEQLSKGVCVFSVGTKMIHLQKLSIVANLKCRTLNPQNNMEYQ